MRRIPLINGLRGLAILGVLFIHVFHSEIPKYRLLFFSLYDIPFFPLTPLTNGYMGVSVFFILSGFVLALPYAEDRRPMDTLFHAFVFYRRRARRIFPLFWFIMVPILLWKGSDFSFSRLLYDAFLILSGLAALKPSVLIAYYGVAWSLAVEIIFSVLFPPLLRAMRYVGYVWIVSFMVACSFCVRFYAFLQTDAQLRQLIFYSVPGSIDYFVAGMAVAFAFSAKQKIKFPIWIFIVGVAFLYIACAMKDAMFVDKGPIILFQLSETIFLVGFSLILSVLLVADWQWVKILLCTRYLQMLGMMCYSIYLQHFWLLAFMKPGLNPFLLIMYGILLFIFSLCTYRFIEFPMRQWRELVPEKIS